MEFKIQLGRYLFFIGIIGVVQAKKVREGVKIRPEILGIQSPAAFHGNEIGDNSTTTHVSEQRIKVRDGGNRESQSAFYRVTVTTKLPEEDNIS